MRVGAVEETITVSGETPVVDLQSTTRQAVIDQESPRGDSQLAQPVHARRADSRRAARRRHGPDVGGSVVQEVASLEPTAAGSRTSA